MQSSGYYDVLIIGAGPIGLASALEAQKHGLSHVVVEKGCLANSIFNYPISMKFFSTPELLEIGDVPFICREEKPTRSEALEYYRRVAESRRINLRLYEEVVSIEGDDGHFVIQTSKATYQAAKVICATGFFDIPRRLNVPGEELPKVTHYYKEPFPYAFQKVLVVGNGNSAAQVALECYRHGAEVSVAVRADAFKEGVKYWILPDIENRVKFGEITGYFHTEVLEIKPQSVVLRNQERGEFEIENDFVLAMTGYEPNFTFLEKIGIRCDTEDIRVPVHDPEYYETNSKENYLAVGVCGGQDTGRWFIENSREHAEKILSHLVERMPAASI